MSLQKAAVAKLGFKSKFLSNNMDGKKNKISKKPTPLGGTGRPHQTIETDTDGTRNIYQQPPIPKSAKAVKFQVDSKKERGAKLLEIDKQDRIAQNKSKGKTNVNSKSPKRSY